MTRLLRIVTVNTGKGDGAYRRRMELLIAGLKQLAPDIILLLEALAIASGTLDTTADLAAGLGMPSFFATPRTKSRKVEDEWLMCSSGLGAVTHLPLLGERTQAWRQEHDPEQAVRIPPHATLCYWAPEADPALLKQQIFHAFDRPVTVRLGKVRQFDNRDRTLYIEVLETGELDAARACLYDGSNLQLPGEPEWTWHITCIRYTRCKDTETLLGAAEDLDLDCAWRLDTVSYMELRDKRYAPITEWKIA